MTIRERQVSDCGGCGSEERWLLHNVRHRGIYRRLCTSCVLKFHVGSFCPICFQVYDGSSPPPNDRITCSKCPSSIHVVCVKGDTSSYTCPSCSNPSFVFFDLGGPNKKSRIGGDGELVSVGHQRRIFDVESAKVLVAAAQISSVSMSKAANAARIEAERRVKEASLARKRAREALEWVSSLEAKNKEKGKETTATAMEVLSPVEVAEERKNSKGNGIATQNQIRAGGNNKFEGVSASLNNGVGFHGSETVQRPPKNGVSVDCRNKLEESSAPVRGYQPIQNSDKIYENEKSSNLTQLQSHLIKGEDEKNGLCSAPLVADQGKSNALVDSVAVSQLPQLNQDALVSKTDSGVLLKGSSNMES